MSRGGNWIPLDKSLAQEFKAIKRPFSLIEAMFSYTLDIDCGIEKSIVGYSRIWNWSRNKTHKFIKGIRTEKGHIKDRKRTVKGQAIHFIDEALWSKKDSKRAEKGQKKDRKRTGTINPNPNPNQELKTYLQEQINQHNFIETKDTIFEFYQYRMSMPVKDRYQTEKGIDYLFKDLNGCRKAGLIVSECLDEAIGRGWKTPKPSYFKNNKQPGGYQSRSDSNKQACVDFINEMGEKL